MAIDEGTPVGGYGCTCNKVWGIGLPFDHPIWESIRCKAHYPNRPTTRTVSLGSCAHDWRGRHLVDPECSKCGKRRSQDNTFTITYDRDVQWSWTSDLVSDHF